MYTRFVHSDTFGSSLQVGDLKRGGYNIISEASASAIRTYLQKVKGQGYDIPGNRRLIPTTRRVGGVDGVDMTDLEVSLLMHGAPMREKMNVIKHNFLAQFVYQSAISSRGGGALPAAVLIDYLEDELKRKMYVHHGIQVQGYLGRVVVITDRAEDDYFVAPVEGKDAVVLRSTNKLASGTHRKVKGTVFFMVPSSVYAGNKLPLDLIEDHNFFNVAELKVNKDALRYYADRYTGNKEDFNSNPGDFGESLQRRNAHQILSLVSSDIQGACIKELEHQGASGYLDSSVAYRGAELLKSVWVKPGLMNGLAIDALERMDAYDAECIMDVILTARAIPHM